MTVLAITGITNAFNLIDGIDGLAGGLAMPGGAGNFPTLMGDGQTAFIAFSLAGGLLAFLYFNLNPARIFMGDTGSLATGLYRDLMYPIPAGQCFTYFAHLRSWTHLCLRNCNDPVLIRFVYSR